MKGVEHLAFIPNRA